MLIWRFEVDLFLAEIRCEEPFTGAELVSAISALAATKVQLWSVLIQSDKNFFVLVMRTFRISS